MQPRDADAGDGEIADRLETGVVAHGLQIRINHREHDRWVEPRAMHADPAAVPVVRQSGSTVRVLHGVYAGQSPAYQMVTPVTLLHVQLDAHAQVTVPAATMAFVYGLKGGAVSGDATLDPQVLLTYAASGDAVHVAAGAAGAEFMVGSGEPIGEPIVYGGPFVMTTAAQMTETRRRNARGEMGTLAPLRS